MTDDVSPLAVQSASIRSESRNLPAANPRRERCGRELLRLRFGGAVVAVGGATEPTRKGEDGSLSAFTGAEMVLSEVLSIMVR